MGDPNLDDPAIGGGRQKHDQIRQAAEQGSHGLVLAQAGTSSKSGYQSGSKTLLEPL
jgi:hypothetical protein